MDPGLVQGSLEEVRAEFLKPRPVDRGVEVNALKQRVNLDAGLHQGLEGSFRYL